MTETIITTVLGIEMIVAIVLFVALIYFAIQRINIKEKEGFEERDN